VIIFAETLPLDHHGERYSGVRRREQTWAVEDSQTRVLFLNYLRLKMDDPMKQYFLTLPR
jgi:hypothetical protein